MRLSRRALLAAGLATAGTGAGAGCLDLGGRPTGPEGVPTTLDCPDDGFRRLDQPVAESAVVASAYPDPDVEEPRFELAAESATVSYGATARFALRNRADRPLSTGPRTAFGIQRETEAGWTDVRGTTGGPVDRGDGTVEHGPGAGFTWAVELTEPGVAATGPGPDGSGGDDGDGTEEGDAAPELAVCPDLGPGPYRFLYWGLDGGGVAAEFELVTPGS